MRSRRKLSSVPPSSVHLAVRSARPSVRPAPRSTKRRLGVCCCWRAMEAALPLVAALWIARLLMSVLSGYVHPDEYFQNLEVMAADVLGAPALRVWEFTTSRPIRCIVAPYATHTQREREMQACLTALDVWLQCSQHRTASSAVTGGVRQRNARWQGDILVQQTQFLAHLFLAWFGSTHRRHSLPSTHFLRLSC